MELMGNPCNIFTTFAAQSHFLQTWAAIVFASFLYATHGSIFPSQNQFSGHEENYDCLHLMVSRLGHSKFEMQPPSLRPPAVGFALHAQECSLTVAQHIYSALLLLARQQPSNYPHLWTATV
jgi:hypothetical protein